MNFITFHSIVDKWSKKGWGAPGQVAKLAFCLEMQAACHDHNYFVNHNGCDMMGKLFLTLEEQGRLAAIPDGPNPTQKTFVSGIALPTNEECSKMGYQAQADWKKQCVTTLIERLEQAGHFQTKIKLCYLCSVISIGGYTLALMFARE